MATGPRWLLKCKRLEWDDSHMALGGKSVEGRAANPAVDRKAGVCPVGLEAETG